MADSKNSEVNSSRLRSRADKALSRRPSDIGAISALSQEEIQRLVHEARGHQIELEMQNEELRKSRIELEELKDRYLDLYDCAPVGYVTLNDRGLILEANLVAARLLGACREDLIEKPFASFVCKEDVDVWSDHVRQVFQSRSRQVSETRLVRKDSSRFHVQLQSEPVKGGKEQFSRCRTVLSDITKPKREEEGPGRSEGLYRDLVENVEDLVCTHDLRGKLIFVNSSSANLLGYGSAELVGTHLGNYLDPEVRDQFDVYLATVLRDEHASGLMLVRTKNGEKRVLEYRNTLRREGVAEPVVLAVARDVTEFKRTEKALRRRIIALTQPLDEKECIAFEDLFNIEEIQKLQDQFADATGVASIITLSDGTPITRPSNFCRLCNDVIRRTKKGTENCYYSDAVIGRYNPDGPTVQLCLSGGLWDAGTSISVGGRHVANWLIGQVRNEAQDADKMRKYAHEIDADEEEFMRAFYEVPSMSKEQFVRVARALFTLAGQLSTVAYQNVQQARFMSDRKRAEQALKKSEQQYRTLFEESMDGVYAVRRDGEITDANTSFLEIFGYTREETIGMDVVELYADPADRSKFQEEIEEKGFVKDYEVKWRKKDGTEVDGLVTSSVYLWQDGSIAGYRGIARDVTIRKRLERQLLQAQKMESIGTLAGGIAHDFNNILTVVLGFSELLLIGKDDRDPAYADLQKINQAARNGAELVTRILAFSRKADINPRAMSLNHKIEQTKELLARTIPKMIEIELVLSDDLATVNADPVQVEQVLVNLAVNAKDAMPDGGRLTIETKNVALDQEFCRMYTGAKPGDYVLLSVSDTGHGMDKETLNRIFEPFFSTKEPGQGTGLGLAMVYGMVKQHGGYITCHSEIAGGTVFKIYLPVVSGEVKGGIPAGKRALPGGTERVLLVDDEEFVRVLGKRILERSGYLVVTASNGKEALDFYRKERDKISLVILDLIMPEMGGRQCLEELLKIDPKARVLIATGFAGDGQTKSAIEEGARGLIRKPYDMKGLLQGVRDVLGEERVEP
jgi:two-component system, cell cycle sensor histidine kinase and response regulator CckA